MPEVDKSTICAIARMIDLSAIREIQVNMMHPIKKAACRSFQTVLKLAYPLLPYRTPQILHSAAEVPALLKGRKISRLLIVTDDRLHKAGLLEPLKATLTANNIRYSIFDETVSNPTVRNVETARARYLAEECQGLIGFGGGSAIDCAKAVGARIARPNKPVSKMKGILRVLRRTPFTIAIPTTSGTGSETTVATVITDDATGHKFPISDFPLIPDAAVLDPEFTRSLPPRITAETGMDALTHAIEAYIGRSTVKRSRENALWAAALISENLETAYHNGNDMTARANMLQAAFLAGDAFSRSYVGYCHAVAHSLGGRYNIAHGLANAVLLPNVLEAYGPSIHKPAKDIAMAMHLADASTPEDTAAKRLITHIRQMNANMGIPTTLPGIRQEDIPHLAACAEKEANPLYPVPVLMTRKELEQFYYDVMEAPHDKRASRGDRKKAA